MAAIRNGIKIFRAVPKPKFFRPYSIPPSCSSIWSPSMLSTSSSSASASSNNNNHNVNARQYKVKTVDTTKTSKEITKLNDAYGKSFAGEIFKIPLSELKSWEQSIQNIFNFFKKVLSEMEGMVDYTIGNQINKNNKNCLTNTAVKETVENHLNVISNKENKHNSDNKSCKIQKYASKSKSLTKQNKLLVRENRWINLIQKKNTSTDCISNIKYMGNNNNRTNTALHKKNIIKNYYKNKYIRRANVENIYDEFLLSLQPITKFHYNNIHNPVYESKANMVLEKFIISLDDQADTEETVIKANYSSGSISDHLLKAEKLELVYPNNTLELYTAKNENIINNYSDHCLHNSNKVTEFTLEYQPKKVKDKTHKAMRKSNTSKISIYNTKNKLKETNSDGNHNTGCSKKGVPSIYSSKLLKVKDTTTDYESIYKERIQDSITLLKSLCESLKQDVTHVTQSDEQEPKAIKPCTKSKILTKSESEETNKTTQPNFKSKEINPATINLDLEKNKSKKIDYLELIRESLVSEPNLPNEMFVDIRKTNYFKQNKSSTDDLKEMNCKDNDQLINHAKPSSMYSIRKENEFTFPSKSKSEDISSKELTYHNNNKEENIKTSTDIITILNQSFTDRKITKADDDINYNEYVYSKWAKMLPTLNQYSSLSNYKYNNDPKSDGDISKTNKNCQLVGETNTPLQQTNETTTMTVDDNEDVKIVPNELKSITSLEIEKSSIPVTEIIALLIENYNENKNDLDIAIPLTPVNYNKANKTADSKLIINSEGKHKILSPILIQETKLTIDTDKHFLNHNNDQNVKLPIIFNDTKYTENVKQLQNGKSIEEKLSNTVEEKKPEKMNLQNLSTDNNYNNIKTPAAVKKSNEMENDEQLLIDKMSITNKKSKSAIIINNDNQRLKSIKDISPIVNENYKTTILNNIDHENKKLLAMIERSDNLKKNADHKLIKELIKLTEMENKTNTVVNKPVKIIRNTEDVFYIKNRYFLQKENKTKERSQAEKLLGIINNEDADDIAKLNKANKLKIEKLLKEEKNSHRNKTTENINNFTSTKLRADKPIVNYPVLSETEFFKTMIPEKPGNKITSDKSDKKNNLVKSLTKICTSLGNTLVTNAIKLSSKAIKKSMSSMFLKFDKDEPLRTMKLIESQKLIRQTSYDKLAINNIDDKMINLMKHPTVEKKLTDHMLKTPTEILQKLFTYGKIKPIMKKSMSLSSINTGNGNNSNNNSNNNNSNNNGGSDDDDDYKNKIIYQYQKSNLINRYRQDTSQIDLSTLQPDNYIFNRIVTERNKNYTIREPIKHNDIKSKNEDRPTELNFGRTKEKKNKMHQPPNVTSSTEKENKQKIDSNKNKSLTTMTMTDKTNENREKNKNNATIIIKSADINDPKITFKELKAENRPIKEIENNRTIISKQKRENYETNKTHQYCNLLKSEENENTKICKKNQSSLKTNNYLQFSSKSLKYIKRLNESENNSTSIYNTENSNFKRDININEMKKQTAKPKTNATSDTNSEYTAKRILSSINIYKYPTASGLRIDFQPKSTVNREYDIKMQNIPKYFNALHRHKTTPNLTKTNNNLTNKKPNEKREIQPLKIIKEQKTENTEMYEPHKILNNFSSELRKKDIYSKSDNHRMREISEKVKKINVAEILKQKDKVAMQTNKTADSIKSKEKKIQTEAKLQQSSTTIKDAPHKHEIHEKTTVNYLNTTVKETSAPQDRNIYSIKILPIRSPRRDKTKVNEQLKSISEPINLTRQPNTNKKYNIQGIKKSSTNKYNMESIKKKENSLLKVNSHLWKTNSKNDNINKRNRIKKLKDNKKRIDISKTNNEEFIKRQKINEETKIRQKRKSIFDKMYKELRANKSEKIKRYTERYKVNYNKRKVHNHQTVNKKQKNSSKFSKRIVEMKTVGKYENNIHFTPNTSISGTKRATSNKSMINKQTESRHKLRENVIYEQPFSGHKPVISEFQTDTSLPMSISENLFPDKYALTHFNKEHNKPLIAELRMKQANYKNQERQLHLFTNNIHSDKVNKNITKGDRTNTKLSESNLNKIKSSIVIKKETKEETSLNKYLQSNNRYVKRTTPDASIISNILIPAAVLATNTLLKKPISSTNLAKASKSMTRLLNESKSSIEHGNNTRTPQATNSLSKILNASLKYKDLNLFNYLQKHKPNENHQAGKDTKRKYRRKADYNLKETKEKTITRINNILHNKTQNASESPSVDYLLKDRKANTEQNLSLSAKSIEIIQRPGFQNPVVPIDKKIQTFSKIYRNNNEHNQFYKGKHRTIKFLREHTS